MKVNKIKVMVIAGHTKQVNVTIKGEKEQQVREYLNTWAQSLRTHGT